MQKKSTILFILVGIISSVGLAQLQDIAGRKPAIYQTKLISAYKSPDTALSFDPVLLNNINIRAVRDFVRSYKNPTDVRWTVLEDGFRVHFYCNEVQTRIFYDKKGNREVLVRYYSEDKLAADIRHLVKSTYYDFDIFNVTEIIKGDKTVYVVKLEDKRCWKTITLADGEIEITEEYLKR